VRFEKNPFFVFSRLLPRKKRKMGSSQISLLWYTRSVGLNAGHTLQGIVLVLPNDCPIGSGFFIAGELREEKPVGVSEVQG
jgi:hypothetical protein